MSNEPSTLLEILLHYLCWLPHAVMNTSHFFFSSKTSNILPLSLFMVNEHISYFADIMKVTRREFSHLPAIKSNSLSGFLPQILTFLQFQLSFIPKANSSTYTLDLFSSHFSVTLPFPKIISPLPFSPSLSSSLPFFLLTPSSLIH